MTEVIGALFVDGANWSHRLEGGRFKLDYNLLISKLHKATGAKIPSLSYYTTYRSPDNLERRRSFLDFLSRMGWVVHTMPATLGADGRWRDKEVDISIALDAYEEAKSGRAKAILIGSGDEDFGGLFRRLPKDVQAWAIGFRASMSFRLTKLAKPIFIEDLGVLREVAPIADPIQIESPSEPLTEKERKARQAKAREAS